MDKNEFYAQMAELLEVPAGTVQGSTNLASLEEWNSLAMISFIALADSSYGASVSANALTACQTVDDLAQAITAAQGK